MNSLVFKYFKIGTKDFASLQKGVFKDNKTGQKSELSSTLVLCNLHKTYTKVAFHKFSVKKVILNIFENPRKQRCWPQVYNFIKKEALTHVFSSEFYKISKNNFFTEQN